MISNQILQSTIDGLSRISRLDFGIYSARENCLLRLHQISAQATPNLSALLRVRQIHRPSVVNIFSKYMTDTIWNTF